MRVYAYEDRSGDARFGVLARGGLLTAAQLEKRGGLGSKRSTVFTYADVGYQIRHVDDWLHQVGAATQKALRAGAKVVPVDSRPQFRRPGGRGRARRGARRAAVVREVQHRGRRRRRRDRAPPGTRGLDL